MEKTIFEELGGRYERQGDYLIPCIALPAEKEQPIGLFGRRHLDYLKQHRRVTYTIFSQAAGSIPTLPTLTGRRRNALNGS